jgi:hypothetical protein
LRREQRLLEDLAMLRFSGMPTPSRALLQPDNHLLGNVPHDELCHIAINDSTDAVKDILSMLAFVRPAGVFHLARQSPLIDCLSRIAILG